MTDEMIVKQLRLIKKELRELADLKYKAYAAIAAHLEEEYNEHTTTMNMYLMTVKEARMFDPEWIRKWEPWLKQVQEDIEEAKREARNQHYTITKEGEYLYWLQETLLSMVDVFEDGHLGERPDMSNVEVDEEDDLEPQQQEID